MDKFFIKRFGVVWRINLINFSDEKIYSKFPKELSEGEEVDIDIFFWRDENNYIKEKASKGKRAACIERSWNGFILANHDIDRRKVFCFFENEVPFSHVLCYEVNQSFRSFHSILNAFFLHSSSVISGNKTYLFVAPSEGGKTTIAELARNKGFKVLDEESCIIKKKADKYFAQSFPIALFPGFVDEEREVGGVFFLKKAINNKLKMLSNIDALRKAMPETEGLYDGIVPEEHRTRYKKNVFNLVDSFLNNVDFRLLEFNKQINIETCLKKT